MKILIGGLCLLLLTACQSGGTSGDGGGGSGPSSGKRMTLKTKEDLEYLQLVHGHGTKDWVTRRALKGLIHWGIAKRYDGVNEGDVEEQLNKIIIDCEGDDCYMGTGD